MKIDGSRSNDRATGRLLADYAAFERDDGDGMRTLLGEDVFHDLAQGPREAGRAAFAACLRRMAASYREQLRDIVAMAAPDRNRAAAEYMVHGEYRRGDAGLPPVRGQRYALPGGAVFAIRDGRIRRISSRYNRREWLAQVG